MIRLPLIGLTAVLLLVSSGLTLAEDVTSRHWQGTYPVAELHRFPDDQRLGAVGYIVDQETWSSVWSGFDTSDPPLIDFPNDFVVYAHNVDFVNVISPLSVSVDDQGVAEIVAATTLTAQPIEDFVYWSAAALPTEGVRQLHYGGQFLTVNIPEPTSVSLAAMAFMGVCTLARASRRQR